MSHTPGPWTYDIHEHSFYIFGPDMAMVADGDPDQPGIARMRGVGRGADEHEQEANALLIATAPNLLKVAEATYHLCESLLACREGATDDLIRSVRDAAKAAIEKAKGVSR